MDFAIDRKEPPVDVKVPSRWHQETRAGGYVKISPVAPLTGEMPASTRSLCTVGALSSMALFAGILLLTTSAPTPVRTIPGVICTVIGAGGLLCLLCHKKISRVVSRIFK